MRLNAIQGQHQTQSPMTSAHIAQTMTLLHMTSIELLQTIDMELSRNPALEIVDERRCPMCGRIIKSPGPCLICSQPKSLDPDETIVFISPRDDFYSYNSRNAFSDDNYQEEPFTSNILDLPTYVFQQVAPELAIDEREITAMILANLNEDGFLDITVREICRFHHTTPDKVENVLKKIRRCDPLGVSSRNIREALLAQVEFLSESTIVPEFVFRSIAEEFDLLTKNHFSDIAKKFGTTIQKIKLVSQYISDNLNPFPARANWGTFRQPNNNTPDVFHQPDVIINYLNNKPGNPLVIEIITPSRGTLRINPLFKKVFKEQPGESHEGWKKDIEKASLLIKCIQQRNNTMRQLMEKLVTIQKSFIIHGDAHQVPLTRAQISEALNVHESTISRAVANKTVQLPNKKILPMSIFFDRSLAVRAILKKIIDDEKHAMNDTEICRTLETQGINIARRTVAKYRSMEGILPAHLRRVEKFAAA